MAEKNLDLDFGTDGVIRSIYDDKLIKFSEDVGDMAQVCRLSHVEWEHLYGWKGWTVRAAHDTELAIRFKGDKLPKSWHVSKEGEIVVFLTREQALEEEKKFTSELMPPKEKR